MKVQYKAMLHGYSGKMDDMIYYVDQKTGATLARKTFKFKDHPGQPSFRSAQKAIYAIKPSEFFKYNLMDYILAYNKLPDNRFRPMVTWTNVYNKLMFAMQAAMPAQVDLKTITREQIITQNLPCITLKAAIEANLLPLVDGYARWDKQI
jgi:hypothetical protein